MRTEFKGILNEEAAHTTSPVRIFSPPWRKRCAFILFLNGLVVPRLLLRSSARFDPFINFKYLRPPRATNLVGWQSAALDPSVNCVTAHAQVGGDFVNRQPSSFHYCGL